MHVASPPRAGPRRAAVPLGRRAEAWEAVAPWDGAAGGSGVFGEPFGSATLSPQTTPKRSVAKAISRRRAETKSSQVDSVIVTMRHLLLLATSAYAFVACNRTKVAFYHVPKTGGFSVTNALLAADESCVKLWYILQSEYDIVRRRQDRMHVTPLELENFAKRDNDEDFKQVEVDGVNRKYKTFTVVRNP